MLMAISVLGALYEKQATGKGRRLQLAMQDAVMHYIRTSFAVMNQQGNKEAAPRMGAQSTSGAPAPCGIYPCKPFGYNDYVYIFCSRANPEHWDRLLKVIGREELLDRSALRHQRGAQQERRSSSTRSSPSGRASTPRKRRCRSSAPPGCRPARCTTRSSCRTTRASRSAASCRRCTTRDGDWVCETWPVRFDGKPPELQPSPKLGQHTEDVFASWLGLSQSDIEKLRAEKVLGQ